MEGKKGVCEGEGIKGVCEGEVCVALVHSIMYWNDYDAFIMRERFLIFVINHFSLSSFVQLLFNSLFSSPSHHLTSPHLTSPRLPLLLSPLLLPPPFLPPPHQVSANASSLKTDDLISHHLDILYESMLESNLLKIIHPYR